MRLLRLCATAALLAACRAENLVSIPGTPDRTVFVAVGQELDMTLQTIGPGEYASPPTISSGALRFLDVIMVTPAVPAGPTQRFRFRAEAPGQAVVTFHPTGQSPAVEDTVNVR
jgi:hypothetical protein